MIIDVNNTIIFRGPPMVLAHRLAVRMVLPGVPLRSAHVQVVNESDFGVGIDQYGKSLLVFSRLTRAARL